MNCVPRVVSKTLWRRLFFEGGLQHCFLQEGATASRYPRLVGLVHNVVIVHLKEEGILDRGCLDETTARMKTCPSHPVGPREEIYEILRRKRGVSSPENGVQGMVSVIALASLPKEPA